MLFGYLARYEALTAVTEEITVRGEVLRTVTVEITVR
jgi:hypothetical protein